MKYLSFAAILFFSSMLHAQSTPEVILHNSVLQPGDLFEIGPRSISFKEVISDSRCPTDVTCVWAGEARVILAIFKDGIFLENLIVSIGTGNVPLSFSDEGVKFSISGMDLSPYPTTKCKIKNSEYILHLNLKEELKIKNN